MKHNIIGASTLAVFILAAFAASIGGSFFMASLTANAWIAPAFAPPAWVFGPVWTVLYTMMGLSAYWLATSPVHELKPMALAFFSLQLALNAIWTPVFFGAASLTGGLVIILALWASILSYVLITWRINKVASYLFMPYLAWVSFATVLNLSYLVLN